MKTAHRLPLAPILCLTALGALADETGDEPQIEEVVVTAHPLSADGLAQPVESLRGEELNRKIADTVGATVAREPGIHTSSFGPPWAGRSFTDWTALGCASWRTMWTPWTFPSPAPTTRCRWNPS